MNRHKEVKSASILGIIGNLVLLIIKGISGIVTGSEAMTADAFNSAGDIISSLMTYIGNKIASMPSDDDHNLGHGKAEYIYSLLVSIIIMLTSYKVLKDSILAIIRHTKFSFSPSLIVVCIITILIKLFLYIYTRRICQKQKNLLLEANSKDHRNDILISSLNLISCICAMNNIYIVDSMVGIVIGIWILITAVKIYKESYDILMDKSAPEEIKNKVYDIIKTHPEIKKVIHFNSNPVGFRYHISFTIYLDGNLSTFKSHEIANNLEKEIDEKVKEVYLTVIHVNPWEE